MESNGVHLHEIPSNGVHFQLLETATPDDTAETETPPVAAPHIAPVEESTPDAATATHATGYAELLEVLQTLEAQTWDVKKRGEVLQDMVEDVAESPTCEASQREPLLETAKTLCSDLQDLYRTIRTKPRQNPRYTYGYLQGPSYPWCIARRRMAS
jgi:hypothetical protein